MSKFDDFLNEAKNEVAHLIGSSFLDFKNEAEEVSKKFLEEMEEDLNRWTKQVESGELFPSDLEVLLLGQKDLMEIHLLSIKGMAKIEIDKFQNALVNVLIKTAKTVFV